MSCKDRQGQACADRNCQRQRGHQGMHMSRTWDPMNCTEIIDEWGNVDVALLIACVAAGKG